MTEISNISFVYSGLYSLILLLSSLNTGSILVDFIIYITGISSGPFFPQDKVKSGNFLVEKILSREKSFCCAGVSAISAITNCVTVGKLLISESVSSSKPLEVCMEDIFRAVIRSKELRKGITQDYAGLVLHFLSFFFFFFTY